jgi:GDP-mannose transporter
MVALAIDTMSEDIFALGAYCLSSILMTLLNKAVLSSSNFRMNFLLLAIQALCSVALLLTFRRSGMISFRPLNKPDCIQCKRSRRGSAMISERWRLGLPVSLLLICMIYTGSKAIQYLTVAMFTVFKNLTIIVVALGEQHFFASKITPLTWAAFGLMVTGSIVGGFNDLKFNALGYTWMMLNSASSAAYLLYMKRTIKFVSFADFDSSFYSNVISLPILVILSLIFENWSKFMHRL